jgi:hypothetical protein
MYEVEVGGDILAGAAMVMGAKFSRGAGRRFNGRTFAGDRLLDGGVAVLSEAQDKTRSQRLPGHQEDQEADE